MAASSNRIEIVISARNDANVREIGERIKQSVADGARSAGDRMEKELGDGARDASDRVSKELGVATDQVNERFAETGDRLNASVSEGARSAAMRMDSVLTSSARSTGEAVATELGHAGEQAGDQFAQTFTDRAGQLRDARGRFVKVGTDLGQAAADGAGRALEAGFTRSGSQAGNSAGSATGRSFTARVTGALGGVGRRVGRLFGIGVAPAAGDAGAKAGKSMTKMLSESLSGGITSPVILIPLLTAALAAAPLAGGALAAGVVLAFGAGLGALGLIAASKLKGVEKQIQSFKKFTAGYLQDIGKPMAGAFGTMLTSIKNVMQTLKPILKGAFKDFISPGVKTFFTDLSFALANLGPAIRPASKAFKDLMDAIGPQLPGIFKQISDAIIEISNTISSNPDLFASLITGILKLIPMGLQFINFLANVFVWLSKLFNTKNPFEIFGKSLMVLLGPASLALTAFKKIASFASGLFGKGKALALNVKDNATKVITRVKNDVAGFVHGVYNIALRAIDRAKSVISSAKKTATNFAKGVYRAAMRAVNKAGSAISSARKLATNFAKATYRAVMRAVNSAGGAINAAKNAARNFARATYRAVLSARNAVWSAVNSALAAARNWAGRVFTATLNVVKNFSPFEHGGVVGAKATGGIASAATGGARGSSVLVGEHGPEIAELPGGTRIRSNPDTRRLLGQGGGASGPIVIQLRIGDRTLGDILIDPIRRTVRSRGGNVQAVLGAG